MDAVSPGLFSALNLLAWTAVPGLPVLCNGTLLSGCVVCAGLKPLPALGLGMALQPGQSAYPIPWHCDWFRDRNMTSL